MGNLKLEGGSYADHSPGWDFVCSLLRVELMRVAGWGVTPSLPPLPAEPPLTTSFPGQSM